MKLMKRPVLFAACALFAVACNDSTSPPVATTLVLSMPTVSLDAIGATQTITATVKDQRGEVMPGATVVWTSASPAVTVAAAPASSASGVVTAVLNGTAIVTATAGAAKANAEVTVAQTPSALQKISGDGQTGTVNQALPQAIAVKVVDRLGAPVASQQVTFTVAGAGSVAQSTVTTSADGMAVTTWTLGKIAAQAQTVTAASGSLAPATFTGVALAGPAAAIAGRGGDKQTGVVGTPLAINPEVAVSDAFGNPVPNVVVSFTAAGGTVAKTTATTDASGAASAGVWTLGTVSGARTMTAAVAGAGEIVFTATAVAGPAADMTMAGGNQSALVGALVPVSPSVRIVDAFGNGVPGVSVVFSSGVGGGVVTGATATTDANGSATVGSWRLGTVPGANVLTATAAAVSLTRSITATATSTAVAGSMTATNGSNQAAMAGATLPVAPSVLLRDGAGNPAAGVTVSFGMSSGGGRLTGATAVTNASGVATLGSWTLGPTAALNTVTASAAGYSSVVFSAAGCEGGGGTGFSITVCYRTSMSTSQRQAFANAAARWGTIITSDLPDSPAQLSAGSCDSGSPSLNMTIDDLVIFAGIQPIDGTGNVLGSAGWCYRRTAGLPVVGTMRFDEADMANLEAGGRLGAVILHEMGHVLGIGTMWSIKGLLQNTSSSGSVLDTYFSGTAGIAAFNTIGGATYTGLKVPVENTGGAGTINAHWRESILQNELMTGYLNSGSNPLSVLTIRSLEDIGYTVNVLAADPFTFGGSLSGLRAPDAGLLKLDGDIYTGRQSTIDPKGRVTRIR